MRHVLLLLVLVATVLSGPGACADASTATLADLREATAALIAQAQAVPVESCRDRRLLVVDFGVNMEFRGLGSVINTVAEALAEGVASNRTVILGPGVSLPRLLNKAPVPWCSRALSVETPHPNHVLLVQAGLDALGSDWDARSSPVAALNHTQQAAASAASVAAHNWHCLFESLSPCSYYDAVSGSDIDRWIHHGYDDDAARVKLSSSHRSPALYMVPEPWAGIEGASRVFAAEFVRFAARPAPGIAPLVQDMRAALDAELPQPRACMHVRHGELGHFADTITDRLSYPFEAYPEAMAAAYPEVWEQAASLLVVTDDDTVDAWIATSDGEFASNNARVVHSQERFRTPHGSHTAAAGEFLSDEAFAIYADLYGVSMSRADIMYQAAREALLDLHSLAECELVSGTATSFFSTVAAALRTANGRISPGPVFLDVSDGVADGTLNMGFLHSDVEGHSKLADGAARWAIMHARLTRSMRFFLTGTAEPGAAEEVSFDARPLSQAPVVSPELGARLRAAWQSGAQPEVAYGTVSCQTDTFNLDACILDHTQLMLLEAFHGSFASARFHANMSLTLISQARKDEILELGPDTEASYTERVQDWSDHLFRIMSPYVIRVAAARVSSVAEQEDAADTQGERVVVDAKVQFAYGLHGFHSYSTTSHAYAAAVIRHTEAVGGVSLINIPWFPDKDGGWDMVLVEDDKALLEEALETGTAATGTTSQVVTFLSVFPITFSASQFEEQGPVFVFATVEQLSPYSIAVQGKVDAPERLQASSEASGLHYIVPSEWSRRGLVAWGVGPQFVHVVPHVIDPAVFHPVSEAERAQIRERLGWTGKTVFLNLGAMTKNKSPELLVQAYVSFLNEDPSRIATTMLVLKGSKPYQKMFGLGGMIQEYQSYGVNVQLLWDTYTVREMADLYRAADAYVAPYLYEGFNLPPLEAIACGTPVAVTDGGPTDAYMVAEVGVKIESKWHIGFMNHRMASWYIPSEAAVTAALTRVYIDQDALRNSTTALGPRLIAQHYAPDVVAAQMGRIFADSLD